MISTAKTHETVRFVCTECGSVSSRSLGRCPVCGSWGTLQEERMASTPSGGVARVRPKAASVDLTEVKQTARIPSGYGELDRVLGGGWVPGGVILLAGEPGVGKSTLLLQVALVMAGRDRHVLYASGEESEGQIALRAKRIGLPAEGLSLLCTNSVDDILLSIGSQKFDLLIVDSIQTLKTDNGDAPAGTPSAVRDSAQALIESVKAIGLPTVIVGHITKAGSVAGPKQLEHMVDAVLLFSGESSSFCRLLRGQKNRYGSVDEVGLFEMGDSGLEEVRDPSGLYWNAEDFGVPGVAVTVVLEGTRPLISEVQALAAPTPFPYPKRTGRGVDVARIQLLLAVLEKRGNIVSCASDVYVNIVGGLSAREPDADLAACLAMASALSGRPLPKGWCFLGEVGLAGEVRPVVRAAQRLKEASKLGFKTAVISIRDKSAVPDGMDVVRVRNISEALAMSGVR